MDLGIAGRTAIVCASSQGLGRACAEALAEAGVNVVINGRDAVALEATAAEFRTRYGVTVIAVAADATTAEGRAKLVEACAAPDILINNAGGPPPGRLADLRAGAMACCGGQQYAVRHSAHQGIRRRYG